MARPTEYAAATAKIGHHGCVIRNTPSERSAATIQLPEVATQTPQQHLDPVALLDPEPFAVLVQPDPDRRTSRMLAPRDSPTFQRAAHAQARFEKYRLQTWQKNSETPDLNVSVRTTSVLRQFA